MFYQIFLSPQVKWSAIISNKHDIYGLPHDLPSKRKKETWEISPETRACLKYFVSDCRSQIVEYGPCEHKVL